MKYKKLGNSGLEISSIGLGCMSFGTKKWIGWDWLLDEAESEDCFKVAVESGINFFDTADTYSNGRSEEIVGRLIAKYAKRDEVVIATKVFFGSGQGPNTSGLSRKHIQQACDKSLKRLGVDTIDLYQIHRHDNTIPMYEILSALDFLVRQGKVRSIGACSMYAWEFMKYLSISDKSLYARFVSMQNHYNLLYREEEREMLPLCEAEGIGVIPWSPLARGVLARASNKESTVRSSQDGFVAAFNQESDHRVLSEVASIAQERGVSPSQVSLAWLLTRQAVVAPIVGASKPSQVIDAVKAIELTLSSDEISRLEKHYLAKPVFGTSPPFEMPKDGKVHDRPR